MDGTPWSLQPNEPPRWYARFELYLSLGPTRSLERVFQLGEEEARRRAHGGASAAGEPEQEKRPGQAWYKAARVWRWAERAAAWDGHERERLRAMDEDRRLDAREKRLGHIERLMTVVTQVLGNAKIEELTPEQARELLPQLRILFRDLIAAERVELGLPTVQAGTGSAVKQAPSHDVLAEALDEPGVREATSYLLGLAAAPPEAQEVPYLTLRNVLARLYPDEASARRVADQAGLNLARVRLGSGALDNWHAILAEAQRVEAVARVVAVAMGEYGVNRELRQAVAAYWRQGDES